MELRGKLKYKLLTGKSTFLITIVIISSVILSVWLIGLTTERTVLENCIISASILIFSLFLFLTIGLYLGARVKNDMGDIRKSIEIPDFHVGDGLTLGDTPDIGEGIGGIIISILLWFLISIIVSLILWALGVVIWFGIVVIVAVLYWIYYRALRKVFNYSSDCKGNFCKSIQVGLKYSVAPGLIIISTLLILNNLK